MWELSVTQASDADVDLLDIWTEALAAGLGCAIGDCCPIAESTLAV